MLKIGVTDIEANNLYYKVNLFHCAWIFDVSTGERFGYRPDQLQGYCDKLEGFDILVGHNFIDYDACAIKKLLPTFQCPKIFDTLVLSRMLEPDRIQGHSLKSWGISLGILKGDYGDEEDAWDLFTEDMYVYCEQDVAVTLALYLHLCGLAGFDPHNPPASKFEF